MRLGEELARSLAKVANLGLSSGAEGRVDQCIEVDTTLICEVVEDVDCLLSGWPALHNNAYRYWIINKSTI